MPAVAHWHAANSHGEPAACQPPPSAATRPGAMQAFQSIGRHAGRSAAPSTGAPMSDEEWARQLQREFDQEVAEKEAKERFECPLCFDVVKMDRLDKAVELDCCHRFCRCCFLGYLEVKIREKRVAVEELVCPIPNCRCEVTVLQVEGATGGTPLWDRFLSSRAELWKPDGQGERLAECPAPGCRGSGAKFLVPTRALEVQCPMCYTRFCPRCCGQHPGVACERHAKRHKTPSDEDLEFAELIRKHRWQRCPCCSAVCDRQTGCNFITCNSEQCRGKKSFCYLCGEELTSGQHFTHFPHGLFENACEKVDRRDDQALPQATWGTPEWWASVQSELWRWASGQR